MPLGAPIRRAGLQNPVMIRLIVEAGQSAISGRAGVGTANDTAAAK
jgi:thiazole synthase ThiGH ThiG subunit